MGVTGNSGPSKRKPDPVRSLVAEQAEDEGLWFAAETAPEAYLQQELRRLHAVIEANDDDLRSSLRIARDTASRWASALDATCAREEAERAVLIACKQALDLYFVWATSGPDKDQEYIDGVLSAQLGQVDEILTHYGAMP